MSTPEPLFTVTLTAAQILELRYAHEEGSTVNDDTIAALDAAKPVRATKPRAPRPAAEPFSPNTGNAAVDEFMRRKHDPKWKPKAPKMGPGLPPLRHLMVSEQDAAEAAWNAACDEAREAVASGKPSEAETTLRYLIARHRNPWRREATERPDSRTETWIFTSPRHPGVAIHKIHEHGSFGSGMPYSTTWRVVAGGEFSEKVHFRPADAELEADALAGVTLT